MLHFLTDATDRAQTFPGLVETLHTTFREGAVQPVYYHHIIGRV